MISLLDLDREGLEGLLGEMGEPRYRAEQLMRWIYRRAVYDPAAWSDLGKGLRERLAAECALPRIEPGLVHRSVDGTVKFRFRLHDGHAVESVLIPGDIVGDDAGEWDDEDESEEPGYAAAALYNRRHGANLRAHGRSKPRHTLCVSSQVGCAMGCAFCFTATLGLTRHLTVAEIIDQVARVNEWLCREEGVPPGEEGPRVTNIVFMGMGEPLHNLDAVVRACRILLDDAGFGLSARRVTVSTSGLVPRMRELVAAVPVMIAVSLNATTDEVRERIMPVNRRYPIEWLLQAVEAVPMPRRRRVFLEYVLLDGTNDTPEDARRLAAVARRVACKVNLIPFNAHPGSAFAPPPAERVLAFQRVLVGAGVHTLLRIPRGRDIYAACGMLANKLPDGGAGLPRAGRPA